MDYPLTGVNVEAKFRALCAGGLDEQACAGAGETSRRVRALNGVPRLVTDAAGLVENRRVWAMFRCAPLLNNRPLESEKTPGHLK